MKKATVRDLRNHYTRLLAWIAAGEEVLLTKRGIPIARLTPEPLAKVQQVNWAASAALKRDRASEKRLSAEESSKIIKESGSKW